MASNASLRALFDGGGAAAPSGLRGLFDFTAREGPAHQFASWLPYVAYAPEDKLFVNRDTLGFMLALMPQSGADERMVEILLSLYATCPKGTGIQFSLFASPHVIEPLSRYGRLRVEDADQRESARERGRPARNANLYRTLARRRVGHYLAGSHASLTQGYHYTVRDLKLVLSVTVPGGLDDLSRQEALLTLREGMTSTLRSANFPSRLCNADDLINWCALFTNPHRLMVDRSPALRYDDGRELRDQIVDFDTQQEAQALGLRFTKPNLPGAVEARFYSIRSFPEQFALWQMSALTGDLMQSALQYACPFLITMGVEILDPIAMKSVVTANHVRATQNAESSMAKIMPDVAKKLQDWSVAAQTLDQGGQIVSMYHQLALFTHAGARHRRRGNRARDLALARLRAQQRRVHAPAVAAGEPADDALRRLPRRHEAHAPGDAQDRGQCDPPGAADRRVERHHHADPAVRRSARPADDARSLRQRPGQLQRRRHRHARLRQVGAAERDRLVVPGGRLAGAPARSRALVREALPQGRRGVRRVRRAVRPSA